MLPQAEVLGEKILDIQNRLTSASHMQHDSPAPMAGFAERVGLGSLIECKDLPDGWPNLAGVDQPNN
jgi:hypothetical protein